MWWWRCSRICRTPRSSRPRRSRPRSRAYAAKSLRTFARIASSWLSTWRFSRSLPRSQAMTERGAHTSLTVTAVDPAVSSSRNRVFQPSRSPRSTRPNAVGGAKSTTSNSVSRFPKRALKRTPFRNGRGLSTPAHPGSHWAMRAGSVSTANTRSIGAGTGWMTVWLTGRIGADSVAPRRRAVNRGSCARLDTGRRPQHLTSSPWGGVALEIERWDSVAHEGEIKALFLRNGYPAFPATFDRAHPAAVSAGGASWVARNERGTVVGHQAVFPRVFWGTQRAGRGALFVDNLFDPTPRNFWSAVE